MDNSMDANEQMEAEAFDRLAERSHPSELLTSDWTFARYRKATLGNPIRRSYPDLVFSHIGRRFTPIDPARPLAGLRILDLGAGDGIWSVILAEQGANVVSVEISPKSVNLARERMRLHHLSWEAHVWSAYRLRERLPEASFDLVLGQAVLHHLTQGLPVVFSGVSALLKPTGFAMFTEPYLDSVVLRSVRHCLARLVPQHLESPDERPLRREDLRVLYRLFADVHLDHFYFFQRLTRRFLDHPGPDGLAARLDRVLSLLRCLHPYAGMIFIAARKSP